MDQEAVQTRILIGVALVLAALIIGFQAFYVPEVSRPVVVTPVSSSSPSSAAGPLNLNTATEEELDRLPGIGPKTAQAILVYRSQHGPFRTVEELLEVEGVGEKTLEKLREFLTLDS